MCPFQALLWIEYVPEKVEVYSKWFDEAGHSLLPSSWLSPPAAPPSLKLPTTLCPGLKILKSICVPSPCSLSDACPTLLVNLLEFFWKQCLLTLLEHQICKKFCLVGITSDSLRNFHSSWDNVPDSLSSPHVPSPCYIIDVTVDSLRCSYTLFQLHILWYPRRLNAPTQHLPWAQSTGTNSRCHTFTCNSFFLLVFEVHRRRGRIMLTLLWIYNVDTKMLGFWLWLLPFLLFCNHFIHSDSLLVTFLKAVIIYFNS